ncbi:Retrovirus-related Pol polyprotein from transposon TNT 1-94 [Bienertia sinuspersici]
MVRSWLFSSVTDEIADLMILSESARQFWEELAERYGQPNAPQLYMVKKEMNSLVQTDTMSVSEYYSKFKKCWDELSLLDGIPECTCGAIDKCSCRVLKKVKEREWKAKAIDFLMGLNSKYHNTRGNILGMEPLPPINKIFQILLQAEKEKEVADSMESIVESSALSVSRQAPPKGFGSKEFNVSKQRGPPKETKEEKMKKYYCDYCNKKGHTRAGCFKLIGFPEWWKTLPPGGKRATGFAGNVEKSNEGGNVQSDPLDFGEQKDQKMISSVVEQVLKALNAKQMESGSSSGYANHVAER